MMPSNFLMMYGAVILKHHAVIFKISHALDKTDPAGIAGAKKFAINWLDDLQARNP